MDGAVVPREGTAARVSRASPYYPSRVFGKGVAAKIRFSKKGHFTRRFQVLARGICPKTARTFKTAAVEPLTIEVDRGRRGPAWRVEVAG